MLLSVIWGTLLLAASISTLMVSTRTLEYAAARHAGSAHKRIKTRDVDSVGHVHDLVRFDIRCACPIIIS
jgi:hypothetical protein